MNLFLYLTDLGIVLLIFEYTFKFISLLIYPLSVNRIIPLLVNRGIVCSITGIKYYIIVLLFSAITLGAINESYEFYYRNNSWIIFSIIGGVVLCLTISGTMHENYKSAIESSNLALARMFQSDIFFLIGSIVLYVTMLFNPSMVKNFVSLGFFHIVGYINNNTIIHIILHMCGALFMISMLNQGIIAAFTIVLMIIGAIVSLIKKNIHFN